MDADKAREEWRRAMEEFEKLNKTAESFRALSLQKGNTRRERRKISRSWQ